MRKLILFSLLILSFFQLSSQSSDSLLTEALKRYPMLEICEIPGFPEKVLCGTLDVYEDHTTNKGKKIPIKVIVLPALATMDVNSAFTFHWGGNGGAASEKIWYFGSSSPSFNIRTNRDMVLIDDRGTGASNIRCSAMDSLRPYSYAFAYDKQLIENCLKEVKDKVNLEFYNTPAVVQDYDLVREWLGLDQFDFFGVSYGVRVGLEYMRNYPDRIRTLTVQGSVPPEFNYVNEMDFAIQEQLDILFQRCDKDSICNQFYPNFKNELYEIRDRLKKNPNPFQYQLANGREKTIIMDDLLFRRIIGHQILSGNANEALPLIVHRAYQGNYAPLIVAGGSLKLDMPVFLSQFCPEEIDRFEYEAEDIHSKQLFTEGAIGEEKKQACKLWETMPTANWLDKELQGTSPILILTGENDANTPVKMGDQVRIAFPDQSRHIILPHQGHAVFEQSCRFSIISQFMDTKDLHSLDTACLSKIKPKPFEYEISLSDEAFEKYAGTYVNIDPNKSLALFKRNGIFYMLDEFSKWSGPSQLLYKGDDTFGLIDCSSCRIAFEMHDGEVRQVKRIYRDTSIFKPK